MADLNFLPLFPVYMNFGKACDILPEVHQLLTLWRNDQFFGRDSFRNPNWFVLLSGEDGFVKIHDRYLSCLDLRGVCVNGLTHINLAVTDLSGPHPPARICCNALPAPVFINNTQFCKCRYSVSVLVRLTVKSQDTFVPAIAHRHFNPVCTGKLLCNVIDLILKPVVIACPSRSHVVIFHLFSVQTDFINAVSRSI